MKSQDAYLKAKFIKLDLVKAACVQVIAMIRAWVVIK